MTEIITINLLKNVEIKKGAKLIVEIFELAICGPAIEFSCNLMTYSLQSKQVKLITIIYQGPTFTALEKQLKWQGYFKSFYFYMYNSRHGLLFADKASLA